MQESDRLHAVATELQRLGVRVRELDDGLEHRAVAAARPAVVRDLRRPPHRHELRAHRPARAGDRHSRSRLRQQDVSRLLRAPGGAAAVTRLVVAIDGPAGAGKSTVSRRLAEALGYRYVDTGAMYRVIGVLAAEQRHRLLRHCGTCGALRRDDDRVRRTRRTASARSPTDATCRTPSAPPTAAQLASKVSAVPVVRERLVAKQRAMGAGGGVVMEGRDIGTVVFPEAAVKIFLDAVAARAGAPARRRAAGRRDAGGRSSASRRRSPSATRATAAARIRRCGRRPMRWSWTRQTRTSTRS